MNLSWNNVSNDINKSATAADGSTSPRRYTDMSIPLPLTNTLDYLKSIAELDIKKKLPEKRRTHINVNILMSAVDMQPGCLPQILHVDYPMFAETNKYDYKGPVPYNFVVSIQEGTHIWVNKGDGFTVKVDIPVGSMLVFAGDLVHAGGCYNEYHVRLHGYVAWPTFVELRKSNSYVEEFQQPIFLELAGNYFWTAETFASTVSKDDWDSSFVWAPFEQVLTQLQIRDSVLKSNEIPSIKEQQLHSLYNCFTMMGMVDWNGKKFLEKRNIM